MWRPSGNDGKGKLDLDDEGARILRSARGICLLPVVRLLRMDAYRAMAASVRSEWAPKADLFSIVTVDFFPAPLERAPSYDSFRVLGLCLWTVEKPSRQCRIRRPEDHADPEPFLLRPLSNDRDIDVRIRSHRKAC